MHASRRPEALPSNSVPLLLEPREFRRVIPSEPPSASGHKTARAAEGTPQGGVAKRSTARLRAVAGASTLLGWGHGRRRKDLRRPLAALRMSAALAADRRRDGSPKGGDLSLTPSLSVVLAYALHGRE